MTSIAETTSQGKLNFLIATDQRRLKATALIMSFNSGVCALTFDVLSSDDCYAYAQQ